MPREFLCSFMLFFRLDDGTALDVLVEVISLVQAWSGNAIVPSRAVSPLLLTRMQEPFGEPPSVLIENHNLA